MAARRQLVVLGVVAVAVALIVVYAASLPGHRPERKPSPRPAAAVTASADSGFDPAAEPAYAADERKFDRASRAAHRSDTPLIDACTGKPIRSGPVSDVRSKADCRTPAPPRHTEPPTTTDPPQPPDDTLGSRLRYCGDRGTCPLSDERARAAALRFAEKVGAGGTPPTTSTRILSCDRQSPWRIACDYMLGGGGCKFVATVEVKQPTFQHALQVKASGGECR
jgi:hypothetical protein